MSKSATRLGEEFGNSYGRKMNQLLKKYGYIEAPGAYGLTEKGSRFGKPTLLIADTAMGVSTMGRDFLER